MQALNTIIANIQGIRDDIKELNNKPLHCDIGYLRVCKPTELLSDVVFEAKLNGSIVAIKGDVTCIMPKMVEGWQLVGANGKAVQFGDSVMRCKVSEMVAQR